jgi:hypothetical protein
MLGEKEVQRHWREGREKGLEKRKGIGIEEKDEKRLEDKNVWNRSWREGNGL